ncbi:NAD(+)/NADH kinase [candidate division KSB1 bacterium]|nr:MAG: NAD(+)/NADH kinase [candidate division KSB1 bacterium]
MILGLMGNLGKPKFRSVLPPLIAELRKRKASFVLDEAAAGKLDLAPEEKLPVEKIPDVAGLVLSFGGDGTLLRTAYTVGKRRIPILGVNLGPGLGYLTELGVSQLTEYLDRLLAGDFRVEERMMLSAGNGADPEPACYALNDIMVGHSLRSKTMPIEVMIDGRPVTTYRCDGLIVATSTGSTAYSMSAGGPIVEPKLDLIIVTPICPHTLTMRPVVISAQRTVEIRPGEDAYVAADGETQKRLRSGDLIRIRRAPFTTLIASVMGHDFYQVLRAKLQWGATQSEPTI